MHLSCHCTSVSDSGTDFEAGSASVSSSESDLEPVGARAVSKRRKTNKTNKTPVKKAKDTKRKPSKSALKPHRQVHFATKVMVRVIPARQHARSQVKRQNNRVLSGQITNDDPHWPWPLRPHELNGPWWKVQWNYARRKELYQHFNYRYPFYKDHISEREAQEAREADSRAAAAAMQQPLPPLPPLPRHFEQQPLAHIADMHRALQPPVPAPVCSPSEDVPLPEQVDTSDRPRASMNRRPKITDSKLATKWLPFRPRLNMHFQALAVIRFDGRDIMTDACNRQSNLRLMKDAAKAIMNAEQYSTFSDDIKRESNHEDEPDGMRYYS
jgi:hypothetical protein